LRDIISCLGNNKEFYRLRIGIGHPGHKDKVSGYVLGKPMETDRNLIIQCVDEAVNCIPLWQEQGLVKAQHRLHSFQAS
jgi:PTH1 family peptidyl-tRNA hydrolase